MTQRRVSHPFCVLLVLVMFCAISDSHLSNRLRTYCPMSTKPSQQNCDSFFYHTSQVESGSRRYFWKFLINNFCHTRDIDNSNSLGDSEETYLSQRVKIRPRDRIKSISHKAKIMSNDLSNDDSYVSLNVSKGSDDDERKPNFAKTTEVRNADLHGVCGTY